MLNVLGKVPTDNDVAKRSREEAEASWGTFGGASTIPGQPSPKDTWNLINRYSDSMVLRAVYCLSLISFRKQAERIAEEQGKGGVRFLLSSPSKRKSNYFRVILSLH